MSIFYEIRVRGHLADHWADWFDGLHIENHSNGESILSGILTDQEALFGVLNKIHALNLQLLYVLKKTDGIEVQKNRQGFLRG
jgi:hypothetical protein